MLTTSTPPPLTPPTTPTTRHRRRPRARSPNPRLPSLLSPSIRGISRQATAGGSLQRRWVRRRPSQGPRGQIRFRPLRAGRTMPGRAFRARRARSRSISHTSPRRSRARRGRLIIIDRELLTPGRTKRMAGVGDGHNYSRRNNMVSLPRRWDGSLGCSSVARRLVYYSLKLCTLVRIMDRIMLPHGQNLV